MTAIEWLEQQIGSKIADANIKISAHKFYELINQAKEMEKQQIIDAYQENMMSFTDGEQYYNGKFESK